MLYDAYSATTDEVKAELSELVALNPKQYSTRIRMLRSILADRALARTDAKGFPTALLPEQDELPF